MRLTRIWWWRLAAVVVGLTAGSSPTGATYSIVAVDSDTQRVGGAGTSCVGTLDVSVIYGSVPGVGAVHAQAWLNIAGRDEAVALLASGTAPADIITAITAPAFDAQASDRQYGVVDLQGRAAGWTGSTNGVYANDQQGSVDTFTYSVQGNILTGQPVLDQAETAFVSGGGCDLAARLMLALEAGAVGGHGDSRCTPGGIPSDSAFLRVDEPGGAQRVLLSVTNTSPASPLVALRAQFDVWRASHPCPGVVPDAGALDAGLPDGGWRDGAIPDAAQVGDASSGVDAGPPGSGDDSGCNCHTGGGVPAIPVAGALLLALWLSWSRHRH